MESGAIAHLAVPGAEFLLQVKPNAIRAGIMLEDGVLWVSVTSQPKDGHANAAVQALLAKAMGVAKTRLILVRGAKSRAKVFRLAE